MKIKPIQTAAFAVWENRIAPVFDTARSMDVIQVLSGHIDSRLTVTLPEGHPVHKTLRLVEFGVNVLVCGAISRQLQELITAYGIQVVAFVAGNLEEVISAWRDGKLKHETYAMPGCRGRGNRYPEAVHQRTRRRINRNPNRTS
jgi:predicted Fe-Mo cluster-binding NifX family protein